MLRRERRYISVELIWEFMYASPMMNKLTLAACLVLLLSSCVDPAHDQVAQAEPADTDKACPISSFPLRDVSAEGEVNELAPVVADASIECSRQGFDVKWGIWELRAVVITDKLGWENLDQTSFEFLYKGKNYRLTQSHRPYGPTETIGFDTDEESEALWNALCGLTTIKGTIRS